MSFETGPSRRNMLKVSSTATGAACAVALVGCTPSASTDGKAEEAAAPLPSGGTPVRIGKVSDVPVGSTARGQANDVKLVVYRPDENTVVAYSDICTHSGCQVKPSGAVFKCPCHGSIFKGADGTVAVGPARKALPRYSAAIDGDWITVNL